MVPNDLDNLPMEELVKKLEEFGLQTTGTRAALRERLRKAMEGEPSQTADGQGGNGGNDATTEIRLEALSKDQLKQKLRELNLPVIGLKAVLRERLRAALQEDSSDANGDGEDEDEEETTDDAEEAMAAPTRDRGANMTAPIRDRGANMTAPIRDRGANMATPIHDRSARVVRPRGLNYEILDERRTKPVTLTYKDVEDALITFCGDGTQNVRMWFVSFEETADLCGWTDVQKVIYAKRLLKGSAKLFANFECHARSYGEFKRALSEEFGTTLNSRQIHIELSKVTKKTEETYQEYIYRVLELASHAEIELEAKLQYIINGVKDEETNKTILYNATTIKELRQRFIQYEAQRANRNKAKQLQQTTYNKKTTGTTQTSAAATTRRCFNCGDSKHLGKDCPNKVKGSKCYSCNEFGHIAAKCPKGSESTKESSKKANPARVDALGSHNDKKTYKRVRILSKDATAVIDPGSDLHLARSSFYVRLGAPPLRQEITKFNGVGATNQSTLGRFTTNIQIDDLTFTLNIDVVPDHFTGHDLILGGELSELAEVRIRKRQAILSKLEDDESGDTFDGENTNNNWAQVLCINVDDDEDEKLKSEICLQHVEDPNVKFQAEKMVEDYHPKKMRDSGVKMRLVLKDKTPVHQNPRRLSAEQRNTVREIVDQWVEKGIARPSTSDYASPIVLVKRKNGKPRLCVDYRQLNRKIIRDRYPLPLVEDQLDKLSEATVYCTLDLKDGFFHVPLDEESIRYTSFVTPDGQYEFLMVPFGLSNSPAVFQRHIKAVLYELTIQDVVLIYLDDLIIPANEEHECLQKLERVLKTTSDYGLRINWAKCNLLVRRVEYLGHIVEAGTIRPSDRKITAVTKFPKPTSIKMVQSFLGLTGYFRKFVPQYALIARPLSQLLKNEVRFVFGAEQEQAFEQLKAALTKDPILKLYKVSAETELHTDASKYGLGAMILQRSTEDNQLHPVYYASWKTSETEERYSSFELEVLAVIKALRKFRIYLLGIPFRIITDCKAFVQTMSKKDACLKVAHWALQLEEFQYTVEHRSGTSMRHVDALSRNPAECLIIKKIAQDALVAQVKQTQTGDPELQKIIDLVKRNDKTEFTVLNGILYKKNQGELLLVIPKAMQQEVILRVHERGHFGWRNTEYLLQQEYWFPRMRYKVQQVINNCVRCLLADKKYGKGEGLLQPLDKEDKPLETYHLDHLGPIPSTKKSYAHILAVVDAFTKFVWLYPTKSTTTDEVITRLKKQAVIFGNPRCVITDRGTAFTSNAFREYCKEENIEHRLITTGVPRGNGQVERMNKSIIAILTKLSLEKPTEWYKYVGQVQQFINASFNRSIGATPFEVLVGRNMRLTDDLQIRDILQQLALDLFQQEREALRSEAKKNILKTQKENQGTYNKKRKSATKYKVGDIVAIQRTQTGPGLKMYPKFLGPYQINKELRHDRYLVETVGEHDGPKRTSTSADHLKPWPQHRGLDYDIDPPMDDDEDDGGTEDVEDDAQIRMAECGNGRSSSALLRRTAATPSERGGGVETKQ